MVNEADRILHLLLFYKLNVTKTTRHQRRYVVVLGRLIIPCDVWPVCVSMCHSRLFLCAFSVPKRAWAADKSVPSSAPAVSTDVVTPLTASCCAFRGVLRSWMLSQYHGWGWWASGTDKTLITEWWTARKLFFLPFHPSPERHNSLL